ncbi:protein kinase [Candidatus Hydrogenedentota bacterium]
MVEEKCSCCGNALGSGSTDSNFLSGPYTRKNADIKLSEGEIILERFKVLRKLGQGGFGTVYLMHDFVRSENMAVKVAMVTPGVEDITSQQLLSEAQLLGKLKDHRHILKVHDIHVAIWGGSKLMLMSMEYADGGTLRSWMNKYRDAPQVRFAQGLKYIKHLCSGVGILNDAGIVLLDIKPENCLIAQDSLKVSDLGATVSTDKFIAEGAICPEPSPKEVGTPVYMSPEQHTANRSDDVDRRSNIYSIGVMLHEMLDLECRRPLIDSLTSPLREVDEELVQIVAKCLKKNPQERYSTAWKLLADLQNTTEGNAESTRSARHAFEPKEEIAPDLEDVYCALEEGRLAATRRLCHKHLKSSPNNLGAKAILEDVQHRFGQAEEIYEYLEHRVDGLNLSEMAELIHDAAHIYPEHPKGRAIQARLEVSARRYGSLVEEGRQAMYMCAWEMALLSLREASRLNPGEIVVDQLIFVIERVLRIRDEGRNEIDAAVRDGNMHKAFALAVSLDSYMEGIEERTPKQARVTMHPSIDHDAHKASPEVIARFNEVRSDATHGDAMF